MGDPVNVPVSIRQSLFLFLWCYSFFFFSLNNKEENKEKERSGQYIWFPGNIYLYHKAGIRVGIGHQRAPGAKLFIKTKTYQELIFPPWQG